MRPYIALLLRSLTQLLLLAAFIAGPANADFAFSIAGATSQANTEITECSGQCNFARQDDNDDILLAIVLSGYYTGTPIIDVGAEIHLAGDPGVALMLRRRLSAGSFALGGGWSSSDMTFKRGDNTAIGDGNMQGIATVPFWAAAARYEVGPGSMLLTYVRSSTNRTFDGRVVSGFDIVNGASVPVFSNTSANMHIEKSRVFLGYELTF